MDLNLQGREGDAAVEEKIRTTKTATEKERARARATPRVAVAGGGGSATTTTEAAVETMAVTGGVDTGAVTTLTTAPMVTVTMMTRLYVCDGLTEEKSVRRIRSGCTQQSNRQEIKSREGTRKTVMGAEECGAGTGEDLEEEKEDNTTTINDDNQQHTTIKQNTVEVGGRRRRWWRR